jgi:Kef-type K+ transport system membrane component KefB
MFYARTVLAMTAWSFLFTLFYLSPKFGLGLIWKEKIRDYDRAVTGLGIIVFGVTIIVDLMSSLLLMMFPLAASTQWWQGLVWGFAAGAGISVVTLAVTGTHRLLYDRFIVRSEPESWGLILLRCSFYVILASVAGLIATGLR